MLVFLFLPDVHIPCQLSVAPDENKRTRETDRDQKTEEGHILEIKCQVRSIPDRFVHLLDRELKLH